MLAVEVVAAVGGGVVGVCVGGGVGVGGVGGGCCCCCGAENFVLGSQAVVFALEALVVREEVGGAGFD